MSGEKTGPSSKSISILFSIYQCTVLSICSTLPLRIAASADIFLNIVLPLHTVVKQTYLDINFPCCPQYEQNLCSGQCFEERKLGSAPGDRCEYPCTLSTQSHYLSCLQVAMSHRRPVRSPRRSRHCRNLSIIELPERVGGSVRLGCQYHKIRLYASSCSQTAPLQRSDHVRSPEAGLCAQAPCREWHSAFSYERICTSSRSGKSMYQGVSRTCCPGRISFTESGDCTLRP